MVRNLFALLLILYTSVASAQSIDRRHPKWWSPFYSLSDSTEFFYGNACTSTTLNARITAAGTEEGTLILSAVDGTASMTPCTWIISANVTVPVTILVVIPAGVQVTVNGGATLTFHREPWIESPKTWLSGAGSVVYNDKVWGSPNSFLNTFAPYVESGCLHGTSGSLVTGTFTCTAVSNWSTYLRQSTAASVTYPAVAGTYWLIAYHDTTTAIAGWTRQTGTHYLFQAGSTQPALPTGALWLARVTNSGSALTAVHDLRRLQTPSDCADAAVYGTFIAALAAVSTTPQTLCISSLQVVTGTVTIPQTLTLRLTRRGGIYLESGATLTWEDGSTFQAGNHQVFYGPGTVSMAPSIPINPAWWSESGLGSLASPWTSTDGTGGSGKALAALREYGKVVYPNGNFSMSATAGVDKDRITLDFGFARIIPTANVTLFNLNSGASLSDYTTQNHTIHVRGGFFDSGAEDSTVLATAFYVPRARNVTFEKMYFRGIAVPFNVPIMDTLRVQDNFFRRCVTCIWFPNVLTGTGSTPQDIYIERNAMSSDIQTVFVQVDSVVDSLNIDKNGAAFSNDHPNSRFLDAVTGTAIGASANMRITRNATEQATSAVGLVRVYDTGVNLEFSNILVEANSWGSSLAKVLDLNNVAGYITIRSNEFPSNGAFAIDVDTVRSNSILTIDDNFFFQKASNSGTCWSVVNVAGTAITRIGPNAMQYDNQCAYSQPINNTVFTGQRMRTFNLESASSITIDPWDGFINLTGSATVNTINITYRGHCVVFRTSVTAQLADDVGNLNLSATGPSTTDSTITVCNDGLEWYETARSSN